MSTLGSLRQERIFNTLREIFRYPNVPGFHVVQFSIQTDHVHLVVEASHRNTFSSGMRSLGIRAGLRLNKLFGRKRGKVVRYRYHRRDLFTALQVRRVLRYVLLNGHKHGVVADQAPRGGMARARPHHSVGRAQVATSRKPPFADEGGPLNARARTGMRRTRALAAPS